MQNNLISSITPGAFSSLSSLEKLWLQYNQIGDSLSAGVFSELTSLNELLLMYNNIQHLSRDVFR